MIGRVGARRARTRSRARDLVAPLAVAQSSGNCGCRRPAPALPRLSVGRSWQTTSTLGKPQIRPFSVTAWLSQEPADKSSPQSSTPTSESDESDLRRQREANSTLELAHSEFIANASSKSKFEISGSQSKGQVQEPPALQGSTQSLSEEGRSTASYRGHEEGGIDGQGKDQEEVEQRKREPNDYTSEPIGELLVPLPFCHGRWLITTDKDPDQSGVGRLSPTSSHLFKLVLPLPRALPRQSTLDTNSTPSDNAPVETAFLLHPSQPLSHVSRLILGSLSPSDRSANVEFRALADINDDKTKASRAGSKSQEGGDDEDGPILHEDVREVQAGDGSEVHELRWSTSTDLGDFVKQSTFGQSFRVVIRPEEDLQKKSETASAPPTLSIRVLIPSFASRTAYLRRRLLKLTRAIAKSTEDKKRLDHEARKGAQRFATAGLGGLVAYWGVVCKLSERLVAQCTIRALTPCTAFFSPLGWDVMEPITYLSGLGTVIGGYLFFLYVSSQIPLRLSPF